VNKSLRKTKTVPNTRLVEVRRQDIDRHDIDRRVIRRRRHRHHLRAALIRNNQKKYIYIKIVADFENIFVCI
jgi:hypothetical protein